MPTSTLLPRAPIRPSQPELQPTTLGSLRTPATRRSALGLTVAGMALAVSVAAVGLFSTSEGSRPAPPVSEPAAPAPTTPDVLVFHLDYQPGQSSTWHRHRGLHAVAILSGTLTVYGADCQPARYGPGESFVGGEGLHLARNETGEPVAMIETVVVPAGLALEAFVIAASAPAGCDVR